MEHALLLVLIFGAIALVHHKVEHKVTVLTGLPYIAFLGHPVTLDTLRDLAIHTFVYSHLSPLIHLGV